MQEQTLHHVCGSGSDAGLHSLARDRDCGTPPAHAACERRQTRHRSAPGAMGPEGVPVPKAKYLLAKAQTVKLGETIDGIICQRLERFAYHIHVHLTIFVDGSSRDPLRHRIGPPLKGVTTAAGPFVTVGSCFMWLHTHALDGIIRISDRRSAPTHSGSSSPSGART